MATKIRYKSASPVPSSSGTMTLDPSSASTAAPSPHSPLSPLTKILSKDSFPSPPRTQPFQRRSELAVLNFHNARPVGESSIVLPPPTTQGHILGEQPADNLGLSTLAEPQDCLLQNKQRIPFGYVPSELKFSHSDTEKSRSLSIQSLISTPGLDKSFDANRVERGMKRKGSDEQDEDDHLVRSSRGGSVMSTTGLSMEDPDVREAVEALGGLKADFAHPPTAPHSPSTNAQPEPLLNLIQSSAAVHPLLSTALSISTSTYAASKSYIPPFRYVANTAEGVAGPVVSAVGKRTGIEDYIRRGLTRNRSDDSEGGSGIAKRRKSEKDADGNKNTSLVGIEQTREKGWQRRLYYSSTGLATALSEDSRRSLKYCLRILFTANANLVKVIETLTSIVEELDEYLKQKADANANSNVENIGSGIVGYLPESCEQRRQRLAESVDRLKDEALKTLKTVVDTISRYAGGALPEQARDVVKRQILSFPIRWQAAASSTTTTSTTSQPQSPMSPTSVPSSTDVEKAVARTSGREEDGGPTKGKAVRVLVMAREGLEMMRGVAEVVEGTLISAEEWCERFGKRRDTEPVLATSTEKPEAEKKHRHRKTVSWIGVGGQDAEGDVLMQEKK